MKKYRKITAVAFSPCFTTEKSARLLGEALAQELGIPFEQIRFTSLKDREKINQFGEDEFVVIAAPTYAGKLPNKIMPDFKSKIIGNNTDAAVLVTYGNRAYENSLAELAAILKANGFNIPAGAAVVNEHSMAHLAEGRPNSRDAAELKDFAKRIADKIRISDYSEPAFPGDAEAPYYIPKKENGEPAKFLPAKPKTDPGKCVNCGMCARICPMGSIDPDNTSEVTGICIKCHACVNRCTKHAKYFDDPQLASHLAMLKTNFREEKQNEFFV